MIHIHKINEVCGTREGALQRVLDLKYMLVYTLYI